MGNRGALQLVGKGKWGKNGEFCCGATTKNGQGKKILKIGVYVWNLTAELIWMFEILTTELI